MVSLLSEAMDIHILLELARMTIILVGCIGFLGFNFMSESGPEMCFVVLNPSFYAKYSHAFTHRFIYSNSPIHTKIFY